MSIYLLSKKWNELSNELKIKLLQEGYITTDDHNGKHVIIFNLALPLTYNEKGLYIEDDAEFYMIGNDLYNRMLRRIK